ncbi:MULTISPECIES: menaquinone biosynthesis decarboxylase [unclassified Candidatus Frackibacter]|uniref:menaquinone biosynthesis decarboxylase n=1 Tax=unclassified Candidatus Frackibacter TaxID=2648818 RepID=UPI0007967319|nr:MULTISPECIES: menaquinone biosynthesis decarboxylase [unclassified Candidatus Frackibacter]KXS41440.1 MAG: 3-octaprenyl-4-hydroxybenzoate carboxy-lyase UbiD [Candidatus Frackibacter sp. T328-2]SDC76039.1 4-hydroxy-3-polyprenylbenzoate decarboxylase [Candidatus Frackibacter sp. WG11]SEM89558.1 4-hydroxy-3-polyprenylbenzoate decarboxylase [Candidatus Frackibacter sp. WG12]SFL99043.1 4-hydroxy-3-polyprenylbenzoate decarboxylase [Candidatus Frackibacter sp. WG13]
MAYKSLRDFVNLLESKGLLKRIKTEVSSDLEITEITDRVSKEVGPALLFENVKGAEFPVLINAFGSYERMEMALEVDDLDDIGERIMEVLEFPDPKDQGFFSKLKVLPKLKEVSDYFPKTIKRAPCQEVVKMEPNLSELPILKCWPEDGGKFITLPLVFSENPETGIPNAGMYRLHVYDDQTTGMHWHMHKDGADTYRGHESKDERMEVAVALGGDPATIYSATAPLPKQIGEMLFAGFLRKEPVEMVKGKTVDIKVPANAEIVIEGYVDPYERRIEGPFGDHTGYYSLADEYPVFHVTCITHRKDAIYPTTIVGKPPMEDCYMAKATERIFLPLLKLQLPEVVDMNLPLEGVFHNCAILSIDKQYPGHAQKVMNAVWGMGQMMFTKMVVIVDKDVDVQNLSEVAWKVFNNIDAERDLTVVKGPLDILDHASPRPNYGSKLGIDATQAWPGEGHKREWPNEIEMSQEIKDLVDKKWEEYGLED